MNAADEGIKASLRTLREQWAVVNEVIGPLVDTPMEITEDRLIEIKMALDGHDQARRHYLDALRIAGRTPWAHL